MNARSIPRLLPLVATLVLLGGCGSNDNTGGPPGGGGHLARGEFRLELAGLGDPSPSHYEAWFVIGGEPRSGGKFRIAPSGAVVDLAGTPIADGVLRAPPGLDLSRATAAFVSVEPDDDADPSPTATRVLGGDFVGATASLSVAHATALGVPLGGAAGQYVLDTPTTQQVTDFNRGVAWIVPGPDSLTPPSAGLSLPVLPESGWVYEGWVMRPAGSGFINYSTGRFLGADGFDSDRAGPTAGTFGDDDGDGRGDGFPFPAEDFVDSSGNVPPLVLDEGGFRAGVSVEPDPDNAAGPFFLAVLDAAIPVARSAVTASLTGFGPIGDGHFEAWARFAGNVNASIGKFRVDGAGTLRDLSGAPIDAFDVPGDLFLSERIFITVEQEGDTDALPSRSKLLDGAFSDSTLAAVLDPDSSLLANRDSLQNPTFHASYFLNTYTTQDSTDFGMGIWFFVPGTGPSDPDHSSLRLPILRDGWSFEGWVVHNPTGQAYSTGKFFSGDDADRDLAGLTAGTFGTDLNGDGRADGPRFPGQEFVQAGSGVPGPLDLDDGEFGVFITIEPFPDNDPSPFVLRLFEDDLVDSLGAFAAQDAPAPTEFPAGAATVSRGPVLRAMTNLAASLPTGAITIATE